MNSSGSVVKYPRGIVNPGGLRNKTAEAQSARRTNERRRLFAQKKYAIFFSSAGNKVNFRVSANSVSLRLIFVAEYSNPGGLRNKTSESQGAQRT